MTSPDLCAPCLLRGDVIAQRYQVLHLLGRGTFAEVYAAHDRALERSVAVKLFGPSVPAAVCRREIQAQAGTPHPHLMPLLDAGFTELERAFLVMPLYRGKTLVRALENRTASSEECVQIACDLLSGLAHLHFRGLVHGDIKPSNIWVMDTGEAILMDFSICRSSGEVLPCYGGTEGYVPSEVPGSGGDERADLFALGVVLYWMIEGRKPFPDNEAVDRGCPPPLAGRRRDVPEALRCAILRALAHNPRERFASAWEMRAVLKPLSGNPYEMQHAAPSEDGPLAAAAVSRETQARAGRYLAWLREAWTGVQSVRARYPLAAGCLGLAGLMLLGALMFATILAAELAVYIWNTHRLPVVLAAFSAFCILFRKSPLRERLAGGKGAALWAYLERLPWSAWWKRIGGCARRILRRRGGALS